MPVNQHCHQVTVSGVDVGLRNALTCFRICPFSRPASVCSNFAQSCINDEFPRVSLSAKILEGRMQNARSLHAARSVREHDTLFLHEALASCRGNRGDSWSSRSVWQSPQEDPPNRLSPKRQHIWSDVIICSVRSSGTHAHLTEKPPGPWSARAIPGALGPVHLAKTSFNFCISVEATGLGLLCICAIQAYHTLRIG